MSDLDRNYSSPFGRAAGRVDTATVDAGLRAYMLRIYNYMTLGLAITGLASLGVYMAAVTTDQAGAAARVVDEVGVELGRLAVVVEHHHCDVLPVGDLMEHLRMFRFQPRTFSCGKNGDGEPRIIVRHG